MRELLQQAACILRTKSTKRSSSTRPFEVLDDESGTPDFQRRLSETTTKTPCRRESLRISSTSKLLLPWKRPVSDTQSECGTLDRRVGRREMSRTCRDQRQNNPALELQERPQTTCRSQRLSLEPTGRSQVYRNRNLPVMSTSLNGEAEMTSALANCTLPRAPRSRNLTCRKFSDQEMSTGGGFRPIEPVLASAEVNCRSMQQRNIQGIHLRGQYMGWSNQRFSQTSVLDERDMTEQMNLQNEMNDCRSVISDGSERDSIHSDSTLVEAVTNKPSNQYSSEEGNDVSSLSPNHHHIPAKAIDKFPAVSKEVVREDYQPKPDLITTAECRIGRELFGNHFPPAPYAKITAQPNSKQFLHSTRFHGNSQTPSVNHRTMSPPVNQRTMSGRSRAAYGLNASFNSLDNFPTLGQHSNLTACNEEDLRGINRKSSRRLVDNQIQNQCSSDLEIAADQSTGPLAYELEDIDEVLYKENDMMRGPHKFDSKLNNDNRHKVRTPIIKQVTASPSWSATSTAGNSLHKLSKTSVGQWSSMSTLNYPSSSLTLYNTADVRMRASGSLCNEKLSTDRQSGDSGFVDELLEHDSYTSPSFNFRHSSSRESLSQDTWARSDPNILRSSENRGSAHPFEPTENIYSNVHSSSYDLFSKRKIACERHSTSVLDTASNSSSINASTPRTNKFNLLSDQYQISGEDPIRLSSRDYSCESLNQFSSSSYEDMFRSSQSPSNNSRESLLSRRESKTTNHLADSLRKNGTQSLIILHSSRSDQLNHNEEVSGKFQKSFRLHKTTNLQSKPESLNGRLSDDAENRGTLKSIQRQAVIQYYQRCLGSGGRNSDSFRHNSPSSSDGQQDLVIDLSASSDKYFKPPKNDSSSESPFGRNSVPSCQTPVKIGHFSKDHISADGLINSTKRPENSSTRSNSGTNNSPRKQCLTKEKKICQQQNEPVESCLRSSHLSSPISGCSLFQTQVTEVSTVDGADQQSSVQPLSVRVASPRSSVTMVTPSGHENVCRSGSPSTAFPANSPQSATDDIQKESHCYTDRNISTSGRVPAVFSEEADCVPDPAMIEASVVTLPRHKRPFLRTISENALISGLRRRPSSRTVAPSISSSNSFAATSIKPANSNRKVFGRRPTFLRTSSHRDNAPVSSSDSYSTTARSSTVDAQQLSTWAATANQPGTGTAGIRCSSTPASGNSSLQRFSSLARKLHWRQTSAPGEDVGGSLPRSLRRNCGSNRGLTAPIGSDSCPTAGSHSCGKLEEKNTDDVDANCAERFDQKTYVEDNNSSYHRDSCVIRSADWRSAPEGKYKRTGSPTLVKLSAKTTADSPSTVSKSVSISALHKSNLAPKETMTNDIYNRGVVKGSPSDSLYTRGVSPSKSILQRTAPCLSRALISRSETDMSDAKYTACDSDSELYRPESDTQSCRLTETDSSTPSKSQNISSNERHSLCCSNDLAELSFNQTNTADVPANLSVSQRLGRSASTTLSNTSSISSHADDIHVEETSSASVKGVRLSSFRSCDQLLLEMPTSDFSESINGSPDHTPSPQSSSSVSSLSPTPLFSSRSTTSVSSSTSSGSTTSDSSSTPQTSAIENVVSGSELLSRLRRTREEVELQFSRYCAELISGPDHIPVQLHALLDTIPRLAKTHCESVCRSIDPDFCSETSQKSESVAQPLINRDIVNTLPAKLRTSLVKFRQRITEETSPREGVTATDKSSDDSPSHRQIDLVSRISSKLSVLKEERQAVAGELEANSALGSSIRQRLQQHSPCHHLLQRYDTHVQQVSTVTALLLGLSGRLARAQNAIDVAPQHCPDRSVLLSKRQSLLTQLREAEQLQTNIEQRGEQLSEALAELLTQCQLEEYRQFIADKRKLAMQARDLDDKLRLGEEQLCAAVAVWN